MKTKFTVLVVSVFALAFFTQPIFAQEDVKVKQEKQEVKKEVPNQENCPIMGGPINKESFVDYNGKRVYFCCSGCDTKFLEDPDTHLKKMKEEGVVLADAPITQETCPVMGKPINKEIYTDHNGTRTYFCSEGCKTKFEKSPEKYTKKK